MSCRVDKKIIKDKNVLYIHISSHSTSASIESTIVEMNDIFNTSDETFYILLYIGDIMLTPANLIGVKHFLDRYWRRIEHSALVGLNGTKEKMLTSLDISGRIRYQTFNDMNAAIKYIASRL